MKCKNCRNLVKRIDDDGTLYDFCGMVIDSPDTDRERNCKYYVTATNADRIRAMSDEELAKWMAINTDCYYCKARKDGRCDNLTATPCDSVWLDWLKQEAEDG